MISVILKRLRLSFALLLIISSSAFAFKIPDAPRGYVHDDAALLKSNEIDLLSQKLHDFEHATSNQIVVAIFPSLDGEVLEDVSIHLAEKWKIGQKGKDNGVILLIFPQDHLLRIEVGYGLESVIPDYYASTVIEKVLKPLFRRGDYYEGIDKAVDLLMKAAQSEYDASLNQDETSSDTFSFSIFQWILFIIFILIILVLEWLTRNIGGGTYSSGGWSSSSGSSSSFGGGGGGSFGGGGSSGSW